MQKRIWLSLSVAALFVMGIASIAAAQAVPMPPSVCMFSQFPNACVDLSCGTGCGSIAAMPHGGNCSAASGGWDFSGTAFANGSIAGSYPKLHFWEYNNYNPANSGCQKMDTVGLEWYKSATDLGCAGTYPGMWWSVQTNWNGPSINSCPAGGATARTVFEFSQDGWFLIMTVARTGPLTNLSNINNGTGANSNVTPTVTIPPAASAICTDDTSVAGFWLVDVTLPAAPASYTDDGGATSLIDGAGIVYANGAAAPGGNSYATYPGWASAPGTPNDTQPIVIPWGATTNVAIPAPGGTDSMFIAVAVHYTDGSVALPNFLGTWTVSTPLQVVDCGGGAVEWGGFTATRTDEGVLVEWTTTSEIDTLGYFVEKAEGMDTNYRPIPGGMVEVRYPGFRYSYLDRDFVPGTRPYYRVVELTPEGENDRTPAFSFEVNDSRSLSRTRSGRTRGR